MIKKEHKKFVHNFIKYVASFLVIILLLGLLQRLLMPKYMSGNVEGAMTAEYYSEMEEHKGIEHDVIFIGDCEVFESFSPAILWDEYGIHSYIRGSAQQLVWQSYYLLEDTLRYEKPDVVVFNVMAMQYNEPQNEAYNRMTLDGMKWSTAKIDAIRASMTEEEHFIDYLFPILRFHSRWDELTKDDLYYLFQKDTVTHNGYLMQTGVKPLEELPAPRILDDYSFGGNVYFYLDQMVALCEENDIELVLIKAPCVFPYWYEEWDTQIEEYAKNNGLKYYNFLDKMEEIGIDWNHDTYDGGLHLNVYGAEKLTSYFGEILVEEFALEDRRNEPKLSADWEEKIRVYENAKEKQEISSMSTFE